MSALERASLLAKQGLPEWRITQLLRDEGVSPKEINEALSQMKIKNALSNEQAQSSDFSEYQKSYPEVEYPSRDKSMQKSTMSPNQQQDPGYVTNNLDYQNPIQDNSIVEAPSEEYYPQEEAVPSEEYYPDYQNTPSSDLETINDIASQIIEEKTLKLKQKMTSFNRFKETTIHDLEQLNLRLQRLEDNINNLQSAILHKIGDYGKNIESIAKEMHKNQESFSKIINPLVDNIKEKPVEVNEENNDSDPNEDNQEITPSDEQPRKRKRNNSFENYLR